MIMDRFIRLLDLLRKNHPLAVHITYFTDMGKGGHWSITINEDGYKDFVVRVNEDVELDETIRLAMKQLIDYYSETTINRLLSIVE